MNPIELSDATADPIQLIGMSFYFDPGTKDRSKDYGMNVVQFYGLGRAGVLGAVDTDAVERAFTFFNRSSIEYFWESAQPMAQPLETAARHVQAAYEFADRTFGAVPEVVLDAFVSAVTKVVGAVPHGRFALFDGYRRLETPTNRVHAAYLGTILLRELRGGAHIEAVDEVGLSPLESCYLQDVMVFKLHGYTDDDAFEVTAEHQAKKARAEVLTSRAMAGFFSVLDDAQCQQLHDGTSALLAALSSPVLVTS